MNASLLFTDDFSDHDLAGWQNQADGAWTAQFADLRPIFPTPPAAPDSQNFRLALGDSTWANYDLTFSVAPLQGRSSFQVYLRTSSNAELFYMLPFVLYSNGNGIRPSVSIERSDIGQLKSAPLNVTAGSWATYKIQVLGQRIKIFEVKSNKNTLLLDVTDQGSSILNGGIAFVPASDDPNDPQIAFDSISVTSISAFTK